MPQKFAAGFVFVRGLQQEVSTLLIRLEDPYAREVNRANKLAGIRAAESDLAVLNRKRGRRFEGDRNLVLGNNSLGEEVVRDWEQGKFGLKTPEKCECTCGNRSLRVGFQGSNRKIVRSNARTKY